MISNQQQETVDAAITSRHSIRAFLLDPVAREDIERILEVASRAPSGTNTQPWKVYVLTGERKRSLSEAIRRRKVGWDLYALLGLSRDNKAGMSAQHGRNYQFFDAPVGFIFTIDRILEQGSWLDYGMFLQNIMVAARGRGLATCPQAAFTQYHRIITSQLDIPSSEMVVCGMALGYADLSKIENTLETAREPVSGFTRYFE